jgi:hypothetical protein
LALVRKIFQKALSEHVHGLPQRKGGQIYTAEHYRQRGDAIAVTLSVVRSYMDYKGKVPGNHEDRDMISKTTNGA